MKKAFFFSFMLLTVIACNNNSNTENKAPAAKNESTINQHRALTTGCYEYKDNGDTIEMKITNVNEKVTANLKIAIAEKDANHGTFVGTLNEDKLIGIYTFYSEGKVSKREIAFLVKGNQLIEGYGELNKNGTAFKDVTSIKYTSKMPLSKVDCNN